MKTLHLAVAVCGLLAPSAGRPVWANILKMPAGQTSLEFVTVGDAGNAKLGNGLGAVAYTYQMGKYEITTAQYCEYLNAVASTDTYGLYNPLMALLVQPGCGIIRSGSPGSYSYSVVPGRESFPANHVSWASAARFCNWLTNGQPSGAQDLTTTEDGSYYVGGATKFYDFWNVTRKTNARYVLPNYDEWYKAAFYKGGSTNAGYWFFPTRSDTIPSNLLDPTGTNNANFFAGGALTDPVNKLTPVGTFTNSPGPYGTYDMAGSVAEWNEYKVMWDSFPNRGMAGGAFDLYLMRQDACMSWYDAVDVRSDIGLRIALVPEPATLSLLALSGLLLARRRRA
jgi:formylglycine-generating enzyme